MKLPRSIRIAFLCLAAFLFQTNSFMASAATVPTGACLYALDSTADRSFQIAGSQSVYTACGVVVESSASDGFEMEGSETLYLQNHAQVSVVGGAQLNGQTYLYDTISGKDVQAVQVTSPGDPLASIAPPTSGTIVGKSPTYYDMNSKPANNTISPGVYCGGLTIGNTNGTAFTMSPGTYIMAGGGLVFNSQAVVKGTGVTVYNTSSAGWGCISSYNYKPVTISGQVTATLSAPTSGAFNGILFFGNRTGCSTKGSCVDQINGGSTAVLNGALYFASDEIEITGSNASGFMMLVADKIYINGNSTFGNNGNPFDGITVSVSPSTATVFSGQTQQFTATVNNSANPAVTWTISPAGVGSISSAGLYTAPAIVTAQQLVTVTATSQADTSKSGIATVTLAVAKTTPTITWATPAAITYGTALSATQLDATASVPGTFVYTPAAGAVLAAGSQTLSVTFAPTNTTLYNSATATVTLTVNKATPVITWATPTAITYGTPLSGTQLNASLSVAGSCVYTPLAGTVLSAGTQTLSVTCTPTDTADYATPAPKTVQLTVSQAVPVITWATPTAINSGTALSATQLDATSTVAGTFSYTPVSGTELAAGTQTLSVTFTPTDTTDYTTATASMVLTVNPATSCAGNGYSFGRAITINHNLVPNTDQTNFPFLFNTTDPLLATTANGGHVSNSNGYDIIFTSDAAGQNPLNYEMEEYNPQTGQVIAWVQIPTVSHTQDTTIYLFYGNPNISMSQQNPTGVWDANYLGVWHVANNGTQLSLTDSTSNQNNATNNGATATTGQIDGGMATDGTTYATVGTLPNLENTLSGTATYSVWVNPSINTPYGGIFGENWPGWSIGVYGGGGVEVELSAQGVGIGASITPDTWSYLTITITQIAQAGGAQVSYGSLYINGVLNQSYSGNPVADVQQTLE